MPLMSSTQAARILRQQQEKCGMVPTEPAKAPRAPVGKGPVSERKQRASVLRGTPYRSVWEKQFHEMQMHRLRAGEIEWVAHEPFRLLIASGRKRAWYKADVVVFERGRITVYEVKGFWREAARLRIKVAAGLYPFMSFIAVTRHGAEWVYEEFSEPQVGERKA